MTTETTNGQPPILEVVDLTKRFNGVTALDQVDLKVYAGELVSLIGPNGSGKTTLFNCISGFLRPEAGRIYFMNEDITSERPDRIALRGICRTFQALRIFPSLTAFENLMLAGQQFQEDNLINRALRAPSLRRLEAELEQRALQLLDQLSLAHMKDVPTGHLSYGQNKLLAFAAALMAQPRILLLDEPAAGVNPTLIEAMKGYIREVNANGTTIVLVEHNMEIVMDLARRIVVLDHGEKIAEGSPAEIQNDERVLEAYFGR